MIARVDKGKTIVIIHKQDYTDKVHTFLSGNNFHTLTHNPIQKDQKATHKALQQCEIIDKKHIKYFTQKTPSPPTLNALIKTTQTKHPHPTSC